MIAIIRIEFFQFYIQSNWDFNRVSKHFTFSTWICYYRGKYFSFQVIFHYYHLSIHSKSNDRKGCTKIYTDSCSELNVTQLAIWRRNGRVSLSWLIRFKANAKNTDLIFYPWSRKLPKLRSQRPRIHLEISANLDPALPFDFKIIIYALEIKDSWNLSHQTANNLI